MNNGAMVKAERVHKSFGRLEALRGVDLEVGTGQVFCIIGPSGSGKSTFLRCINHLENIDGGRLWVDGELVGYRQKGDKLYELKESEVAHKRAEIGMVFQHFNLFPHMTALQNVMEGPVRVKKEPSERSASGRTSCSLGLAWATVAAATRCSSRAASSSGWRSPGHSRCGPS